MQYASDADFYFQLGEILYDLEEYEDSQNAYFLAGELDCLRTDFAYYNAACSASLSQDVTSALKYFLLALLHGYDYWNHIENDSDLDNIRDENSFKEYLARIKSIHQEYPHLTLDEVDLAWLYGSHTVTKYILNKPFILTAEYIIADESYIQHYQLESNGKIYMQFTDVYDKEYVKDPYAYQHIGFSNDIRTFENIPDYLLQRVIYRFHKDERSNPEKVKALEEKIRDYVRSYDSYVVLAGSLNASTYIYFPDLDDFIMVYSP